MNTISRRSALLSLLFGAGGIGLRSLATGIPASILLNPRKALADGTCPDPTKAQYIIMSTSGAGDPINANCPGSYDGISGQDYSNIGHPTDAAMQATPLTLSGKSYTAAAPWATKLLQPTLDRTAFFHMMTNTPIHPQEPNVLQLMGSSPQHEMLPSLLAKATAPCLGTIQTQPVVIGAATPAEALQFSGSALPIIPPLALKDTLTNPAGPLTGLQALRDQTMNDIYAAYKTAGTPSQQQYIDQLVLSQQQVRNLNQDLLNLLTTQVTDNGVASQIAAAVILIRMNVAPLISIHIPFGGDNHSDANLGNETSDTSGTGTGVDAIATLMSTLQSVSYQDKVTFMSLNVFGRTLAKSTSANGRGHNENHHVSVIIGKPFKGGVIGGVSPVGNDYGCTSINSTTAAGGPGGDVAAIDTLASFGKTMLAAVGGDPTQITSGSVITGALAE